MDSDPNNWYQSPNLGMIPAAITSSSQPIPFSALQLKPSTTIINGHLLPPFSYPSVQNRSPLQTMTKFSLPYQYPPPPHVTPLPFNTTPSSLIKFSTSFQFPFANQIHTNSNLSYACYSPLSSQPMIPSVQNHSSYPNLDYKSLPFRRKLLSDYRRKVVKTAKTGTFKRTRKPRMLCSVGKYSRSKMNHNKNQDLVRPYEDMKRRGLIDDHSGSDSFLPNDNGDVVVATNYQNKDLESDFIEVNKTGPRGSNKLDVLDFVMGELLQESGHEFPVIKLGSLWNNDADWKLKAIARHLCPQHQLLFQQQGSFGDHPKFQLPMLQSVTSQVDTKYELLHFCVADDFNYQLLKRMNVGMASYYCFRLLWYDDGAKFIAPLHINEGCIVGIKPQSQESIFDFGGNRGRLATQGGGIDGTRICSIASSCMCYSIILYCIM